jgi:hypothetical protein
MKEFFEVQPVIYNADETGLLWRALPEDTLASWGERKVMYWKIGMEWVQALLCANADWSHMLRLWLLAREILELLKIFMHRLIVHYVPWYTVADTEH